MGDVFASIASGALSQARDWLGYFAPLLTMIVGVGLLGALVSVFRSMR